MKGQLIFEFVIAAFILFAIILYVINYLSSSMNLYHDIFMSNLLESRAIQVSEVLLSDSANGLVDGWPILNRQKMYDFNETCYDSYIELLSNFSMIEYQPYTDLYHMRIVVNSTDGYEYVECGRLPLENRTHAMVTRFGFVPAPDDKIAIVEVVVW